MFVRNFKLYKIERGASAVLFCVLLKSSRCVTFMTLHEKIEMVQLFLSYFAELQEAFVLFDKNRDGMITKEELGAVLYALGQRPTVTEVQSLIRSVDLDSKSSYHFKLHRDMYPCIQVPYTSIW